jgi:hypothetical protein
MTRGHVYRRDALEKHVADRPAQRGGHAQDKPDRGQALTDGEGDQEDTDERDRDAAELPGRRPLAEDDGRQQHREQRLRLHDHGGEARRHPARDGEELEQELSGEEREPDRQQRR